MACCPVGYDGKISFIHSFMYSSAAILICHLVLYILKVDDEVVHTESKSKIFILVDN